MNLQQPRLISRISPAIGIAVVMTCVLSAPKSSAEDETVADADSPEGQTAIALLRSCSDPWRRTVGRAFLRERPSDEGVKLVDVLIRVRAGLEAGKHAVHIHETGECSPCKAANGHFDPGPNSNSSPDGNHPFHAGDLTNIHVDDTGRGHLMTVTSRVTLSDGPLSVFDEDGSAIIIHVDPDTYCPAGEAAGCAGGARAACGIVELPPSNIIGRFGRDAFGFPINE